MVTPYMKMESLQPGQRPGRMSYLCVCDKVVTFPIYEVFNFNFCLAFAIEFKTCHLTEFLRK